jgi:hypothetical protein
MLLAPSGMLPDDLLPSACELASLTIASRLNVRGRMPRTASKMLALPF